MKILNVKLYPSTNSSSSHSFITIDPDLVDMIPDDKGFTTEFGWNYFVCKTVEQKMYYFAVLLERTLYEMKYPEWVIRFIQQSMFPGLSIAKMTDGYIDHQSSFPLPQEHDNNHAVNLEFLNDFVAWLKRKDVLILGGNDNGEEHPLTRKGEVVQNRYLNAHFYALGHRLLARKDPKYGFWTLFRSDTSARLRLSFEDVHKTDYKRGSIPDLVDMKITDFCPYDCPFCYQGSTAKGAHADLGYVHDMLRLLAEWGVFEVALGGGEPTLHPGFTMILRYGKQCGLNMNFTTKNLNWLRDPELSHAIMENATAFAYSPSSPKDIQRLYLAVSNANPEWLSRANLHIVMGTLTEYQFEDMLEAAAKFGFRVTLLGWKETGRGAGFEMRPYYWALEVVRKIRKEKRLRLEVSVDTVFAKEFEKEILSAGVRPEIYHTQDGTFSAYVDAVNKTMALASYVPETQHESCVDEEDRIDFLGAIFRTLQEKYLGPEA